MKRNRVGMSEFGLIDIIKKRYQTMNKDIIAGIGDDAAVFAIDKTRAGLLTIDTLVDNVHFDLSYTSFEDLGHKAMAANLSDIAAMGGRPVLAVVSITIPRDIRLKDIEKLYAGMRKLAKKYGVAICGGDTISGKQLSLTIAVYGEGRKNNIGLRSGAKAGDAILVTGSLGASQAGLDLLISKINPSTTLRARNQNTKLFKKHLRPEPRVKEAQLLASKFKLHGMIDISDGLASELHHLARESRVGILIDQGALPVADEAITAANSLKKDPLEYCLYSGEEYELLFTLPARQAVKAKIILSRAGTPCSIIGQVIKGNGVRMIGRDLKNVKVPDQGYKHF
ncbi:MAG: thiamine-phosphate kinase [Candidatus Edwardsbacteria bacterium]|nr:thiamine-phosphate kinase [Candidatus Edwardsbacteria bacterium]MBU1575644.1 thiamine-phosphate kinase [Candidatus Edwardsbacteria bacterium]MBU2462530.1 thiamine-phosphate kinase [Candidatus Edwardsbacteria bacterium]MBU2594642.1 thiamine-phosphate kinase [Candidatus Edwardsbacteria bacterium]